MEITARQNLEYNSKRELLEIPEYGRHVQKLIAHAKTIEDREYRQAFVERIINLMHQMNPQNKNVIEYRENLWRHVFRIANYELDVTPPSGIIPQPKGPDDRPEIMPYPQSEFRFRHYGKNVQAMIKKAILMENGPIKDGFINSIGNYMKLAYRTWNREHYVNDEIIKQDLVAMSKGALSIPEDFVLNNIPLPSTNRGGSGKRKGHKGGQRTWKNNRGSKGKNRKRK